MARLSRTGGNAKAAPGRRAGAVKGGSSAKTKHPIGGAIQSKRSRNSDEELKEAREQQAATAAILKVIASSPSDVQPVFKAIAHSANRLIGGFSTAVYRVIDDVVHLVAFTPTNLESDAALKAAFPMHRRKVPAVAMVANGETAQIADAETADPQTQRLGRARGWRSVTFTPLMNHGTFIGFIVCTRRETGVLADHHVQLLRTFADQAVIAIENTRLFKETQHSLARQTAMAQVLEVINGSPGELKPVFDTILEKATQLCGASFGFLNINLGNDMHQNVATLGAPLEFVDMFRDPMYLGPETATGRLVRGESYVHTLDGADDDAYRLNPVRRALVDIGGARTHLAVPIRRDDVMLGSFTIYRREVRPFSPEMIALVQSFAAQAAIAIENTRLFNETKEALERQTATAEILRVINSSPGDLAPVFDVMLQKALSLCGAAFGQLVTFDGAVFRAAAWRGYEPGPSATAPLPGMALHQLVHGEQIVHIPDITADDIYRSGNLVRRRLADEYGGRTAIWVALRKDDELLGAFVIFRVEVRPFSDKQIALLQGFSAQAAIAIENARLLTEVEAKTRDLTESLEQQTATSEVLEIISSSPGELDPVFQKMLENACRVCEANFGMMNRWKGEEFVNVASHNVPPAFAAYRQQTPFRPHLDSAIAKVVRTHQVVHEHDFRTSPAYLAGVPSVAAIVDLGGARTVLIVPMLKEDELIGTITIFRQEVRPFTDKQVALVENFTKQAVIAIENTRLLRELRERTADLSESLQQQTATSEVLQIISSSPGELDPVFDKIVENATRVCGAEFGSMGLVEGDTYQNVAMFNAPRAFVEARTGVVTKVHPKSSIAAAIRTRQVVQAEDLRNSPAYLEGVPSTVQLAELGGARTIVVVPMLREDEVIGQITVYRQEVRLFSDKQIELLTNFARQAVIAIENARLLRELRQRTADLSEALVYQTGSGNILKVIASSPTDVGPALQAIVESACEICDADDAVVLLKEGDDLVFSAHHGPIPVRREKWPISRRWITGRAVIDKLTVHIRDVLGSEGEHFPEAREMARQDGIRSVLSVPLLQEGEAVGAIMLRRTEAQPFSEKQIELLNSFADQAVIAISNVRLFEQVQERTRELSKSLDDLRSAQDRLIQTEKLASLGQLTAGIAHEIKNPLNFVNNFSALSVELTDELNDILKQAELAEKMRLEVSELTQMLKSNLEKVVQHGKRADSIVKNMLLHSREGSGEHRPTDINMLVEESLNLAYHGARAEGRDFNISLERDFDEAGVADIYPQEITRALLNLISNGFYAATKHAAACSNEFEPKLKASTRSQGDKVEIRIRDNGMGIPPDIKEKIFNPFFTTKPAGEGTGLGLSMSHDIVVKQHGGTIGVVTEPGTFTEFIITLPRVMPAQAGRQGN